MVLTDKYSLSPFHVQKITSNIIYHVIEAKKKFFEESKEFAKNMVPFPGRTSKPEVSWNFMSGSGWGARGHGLPKTSETLIPPKTMDIEVWNRFNIVTYFGV